jgi:hypothetical protein
MATTKAKTNGTRKAPKSAELAIHTPPGVDGGVELDWLTSDHLPPPKTPGELVRVAVEQKLPEAVDGLAGLAASAKDEAVRLRAIQAMIDLAAVLGIIDAGSGVIEGFFRAMTGGGAGGSVGAIGPPGRED